MNDFIFFHKKGIKNRAKIDKKNERWCAKVADFQKLLNRVLNISKIRGDKMSVPEGSAVIALDIFKIGITYES